MLPIETVRSAWRRVSGSPSDGQVVASESLELTLVTDRTPPRAAFRTRERDLQADGAR
jgi:hypothetical protein